MINFIRNNYTWIFSGIGVAVLILIVEWHKPSTTVLITTSPATHLSQDTSAPPLNLSPDQIVNEIRKTRPMEQDAKANSFAGARIAWKVRFTSAESEWDKKMIYAFDPEKGYGASIIVEANNDSFPVLKYADKDSLFYLTGIIKRADKLGITIENAKIDTQPIQQ